MREGRPYFHEYRLISPDGTVHWVCDEAATVTDAAGNNVVQGVIYDVTDRKLAEQRFRDAESRYRTLVEQLPLAIYIDALDEAATSLYNSPKNAEITGYSHEQWIADPDLFAKIVHPDDRDEVLAGFEAARVEGRPFAADYRIIRPDGTTVWVHDESVVVHDEAGTPLYRQGYLLDISPPQAGGGAAGPPGLSRLADRPAEQSDVPGASGRRARPCRAVGAGCRGALRRPRRLQAGQRFLRPRVRRRAPAARWPAGCARQPAPRTWSPARAATSS